MSNRNRASRSSMSRDEWERRTFAVKDRMAEYVWQFVTPLARSESDTRGVALATGNYVLLHDSAYLLTNEHVIMQAAGAQVTHMPGPTDDYVACRAKFWSDDWPVDVALMRLGDEWTHATKSAIPASRLDESFSPVQHDLLFWLGFPGSTASRHEPVTDGNIRHTWFESLQSRGLPMATQQLPNPPKDLLDYDPDKHVVVHFPARAARNAGGPVEDLPNPKGMSGSLLWDTKVVASISMGRDWSPECARVCGLVWAAYPKPEVVVATKIEYLRPKLLDFLREEAAYSRWVDRGQPEGEEYADREWALANITSLDERDTEDH